MRIHSDGPNEISIRLVVRTFSIISKFNQLARSACVINRAKEHRCLFNIASALKKGDGDKWMTIRQLRSLRELMNG